MLNYFDIILLNLCHFNVLSLKFEELETRMVEIKQEILNSYQRTIKKVSTVSTEDECNDHDYLDNVEQHIVEEEETPGDDNKQKIVAKIEKVAESRDAEDSNDEEHLEEVKLH